MRNYFRKIKVTIIPKIPAMIKKISNPWLNCSLTIYFLLRLLKNVALHTNMLSKRLYQSQKCLTLLIKAKARAVLGLWRPRGISLWQCHWKNQQAWYFGISRISYSNFSVTKCKGTVNKLKKIILFPKHCSCRGAITADNLERQDGEIISAGLDLG